LYFLFVFLPFLPLFIPAMIVIGTGSLILTPTILFFIHGQRILDGYRVETSNGKRFLPSFLAVIALAILPSITLTQAVTDRVVLRHAMDYIYSPDYRQPDRFHGSRFAVERSLERLRDFKAGAYLPFLSDFYNWAVFDNLVLPDDKMNRMNFAFFGHNLDPAKASRVTIFGGRAERNRPMREVGSRTDPVPSDITLAPLLAKSVPDGDCERTTLTLDLKNNSALRGEYVAKIQIPDGVFVSGFWLNIGKERVPGKLFEKKTALWVYQKIRDERSNRDPGILVYSAPNSIELRVFPFAGHETRKVEIEFFYPAALRPSITIGERQWQSETAAQGICLTLTSAGTGAVSIPPESAIQLPQTKRIPYLHFIIDRSADSTLSDAEIVRAIQNAATQFTEAKECAITLANYESANLVGRNVPIDSINASTFHPENRLPRRGGFLAERAIKRVLLAYHDRLSRAKEEDPELERYPVIILLGEPPRNLTLSSELPDFAKFAPDSTGFYATKTGETLIRYDFSGNRDSSTTQPPRPVALLKVGDTVSP
ncbi:MAG: MSEP-CTERM sorting domain-containing protein, partial [Verrucomicrobiota bacterium]